MIERWVDKTAELVAGLTILVIVAVALVAIVSAIAVVIFAGSLAISLLIFFFPFVHNRAYRATEAIYDRLGTPMSYALFSLSIWLGIWIGYFELLAFVISSLVHPPSTNFYGIALAISLMCGLPFAALQAFGPPELDEPGGGPIRMILERWGVL